MTKFFSLLIVSSLLLYSNPSYAQDNPQKNISVEDKEVIKPPIATITPKKLKYHNKEYIDNYYWLKEKKNPKVLKYLQEENNYTDVMTKHTEKLQDKLYKEMVSKIKETDNSLPVQIDNYYYYSRTEKAKEYRIYCRKKDTLTSKEEILLDLNEISKNFEFLNLGSYKVSPNHKYLAYSIDTDGSENYKLFIKNLQTKEITKNLVQEVSSLEWSNDNNYIFYVVQDKIKRPYKLFRHTIDTSIKSDLALYEEKDESFNLDIQKTKNKNYLLVNSASLDTTEVQYLDANKPLENFNIIKPREKGIEYSLENHGDKFLILTNENAKNFKIMQTSITNPSKENWENFLPYKDTIKIDDIEVFKNYLVIKERERSYEKLKIVNFENKDSYYIDSPEPTYSVELVQNPNFETDKIRFFYTSFITSDSIFEYDMKNSKKTLLKQTKVLNYNPKLYHSEKIFVKASDNTMIPVSIVYKKDLYKANGSNPMYLTGYGAYGSNYDIYFSSNILTLLDRGFVYAVTHIRGGSEMGREWYQDGKYLNKKNSFNDFIASAEYLVKNKYTSKDKLVISGASAGGLLMGAVTTMRPDLFKIVVAEVPFVDVINTMMDASLPLTVNEYDEWGNPNDKKYFDYMKSYSPYDNIKPANYPNMLVTGGLNDPRVGYWEPAKFVAKLRKTKKDNNIVLLKTNMGSGHFGSSGRYGYIKEIAFEFAYIFDILGIKE